MLKLHSSTRTICIKPLVEIRDLQNRTSPCLHCALADTNFVKTYFI